MDKIQAVQLKLLSEIKSVCEANGLDYFLGLNSALCAVRWGHLPPNCHALYVFMPEKHFHEFEILMTKKSQMPPNRTLESIRTNPRFPYLHLNYVATDTAFISLCESLCIEHPGISVHICKLLPNAVKKQHRVRQLHDYENQRYKHAVDISEDAPKAFMLHYMNLLIRLSNSKQNDKLYVQGLPNKFLNFNAELFSDRQFADLENIRFPVPNDIDQYLSILHGRFWASRNISFKPISNNFVVDANNSYGNYVKCIQSRTTEIAKLKDARRRRSEAQRVRSDARIPLDRAQLFYERAKDRISLEDQYRSRKDDLIEYYRKGNFLHLSIDLIDYQLVSEKYISDNLPFAFDEVLYTVMCDVFNWQGLVKSRRALLRNKHDAIAYLNRFRSSPVAQIAPSPFRYLTAEHVFVEKRTGKVISGATLEELRIISELRKGMLNEGDEISLDDTVLSTYQSDYLTSPGTVE